MDNKFNFDEFMQRAKEELNTDKDFNEVLLDAAIKGAETDDKRLVFMIARKTGEIMDVIINNFVEANAVLPLEFEAKKNAYIYLCAVENGLKEFKRYIYQETDKL